MVDQVQNQNGVPGPNDGNRPVVIASTNIRPFDVSKPTEWLRWVKLLNFNFTAMHINDPVMKRAHFFSICGETLYNLACNTLHPDQVDEVPYDTIITKLTAHFKPQVNEVAAYHRFHHCNQKMDQTVSEFVAELRRLASDCGFGAGLDNMIRNQLVCGIRDGNVRARLLQRADLTLQEAIETATRAESALSHVKEMSGGNAVHWISQDNKKQTQSREVKDNSQSASKGIQSNYTFQCYRCAGDHKVSSCQMDPESLFCTSCEKKGHVSKICQNGHRNGGKQNFFKKNKKFDNKQVTPCYNFRKRTERTSNM